MSYGFLSVLWRSSGLWCFGLGPSTPHPEPAQNPKPNAKPRLQRIFGPLNLSPQPIRIPCEVVAACEEFDHMEHAGVVADVVAARLVQGFGFRAARNPKP